MAGASVGISLIGITLASLMYLRGKIDPAAIASQIKPLYQLSLNKWYFDDIYHRVFVPSTSGTLMTFTIASLSSACVA